MLCERTNILLRSWLQTSRTPSVPIRFQHYISITYLCQNNGIYLDTTSAATGFISKHCELGILLRVICLINVFCAEQYTVQLLEGIKQGRYT